MSDLDDRDYYYFITVFVKWTWMDIQSVLVFTIHVMVIAITPNLNGAFYKSAFYAFVAVKLSINLAGR